MKKYIPLSIIIPVKNEQDNISWTIEKIKKTVTVNNEIFTIYDSSKDPTIPILKKLKEKNKNLHLFKNTKGNGVLNAIKTGIDKTHGDVIVIMAADRTDDPTIINEMYKKILEGYDIVCPTRYSKGGKVVGPTTIKSVLSRLSGISTPYLLGIPISDLTYSFKMFRKQILDKIEIESKGGFEFAEELLIKSHFEGARIIEIPTLWVDRKYGESKFKLAAWLPRYIYWYLWGLTRRIKLLPILLLSNIINVMMRFFRQHYLLFVIIAFLFYSSIAIFRSSFVVGGTRYFLLSDDLMIQMKYAYNFIHGYGLVWNAAGPRVEGITDPLWVLYLSLLHLFPLPPSKISILVQISGTLFIVGSLYFVKKIAVLVSNSFFVVFLSLIFTAFYFPLINWSVILGTEISIMTLLLTASVYLTLKAIKEKKNSLLIFFVFGVGTFVRMDFLLPAAIITAYLFIFDSSNRKKYLTLGIPIILFFVAFQEILRLWYYNELLPNTYYLRLAGYPLLPRITRGLYVTIKSFLPTLVSLNLFLIMLPFISLYLTKNRKMLLLLTLFSGEIFYNIYLGGDSWEHYGGANHFFAFVMPLFFISLIEALHLIRKHILHSIRFKISHKIIEAILICTIFLVLNRSNENELPQLFMIKPFSTVSENRIRVNEVLYLNSITTPSAKIVVSGAGIISYFGHGYFIDALGKNDKVIAREKAHVPKKFQSLLDEYTNFYSGHMKWDYPYIVKTYKPDIITELYGNFETENNKRYLLTHGYVLQSNMFRFIALKGSKNIIAR